MSPFSVRVLTLLVAAFFDGLASSSVMEATVTNSSGEYYIISRDEASGSGNQSIACSSPHCHVLCHESSSCMNLNISASDAISLTVECRSNKSCMWANILCPKPNISSTDIIDSFCDISCTHALSCANTSIVLHSVNNSNLLCSADKACSYAHVMLPDFSGMGNLSVQCTESASCEHMAWDYIYITMQMQMSLDTLDIQCTGNESCQFMEWKKQLFPKNINLQCVGYKSCQHMWFAVLFSKSHLNIHCGANLACYAMWVNLITLHTEQSIITCDNRATSTNATGACYRSHFKFENYPTFTTVGGTNITCGAFDCQNMDIEQYPWGYEARHLSLYCSGEYSCHDATFDAWLGGSIDVHCKGSNACSNTIVSCQVDRVPPVCNIHCTDGVDACVSLGIITPYQYNYVDVFCESMNSNPSCNDVYFQCRRSYPDHMSKKNTYLKYNDGGDSQCVVNKTVVSGDDYCCPLLANKSTNIVQPTTSNYNSTDIDIVQPIATGIDSKDDREESKQANKSWFVAAVAAVVILIVLSALAVFAVKKRSEGKSSPLLLGDNYTEL